jgi:ribosomal protein L29
MDLKELRSKSPEELRRLLQEFHAKMQAHRLKLAARQSTQTSELGQLKRAIARIETLLTASPRQP